MYQLFLITTKDFLKGLIQRTYKNAKSDEIFTTNKCEESLDKMTKILT